MSMFNLEYKMMSDKKKNLVLVGMPASGKSTIGVILAKEIGFSFLDTDIVIQKNEKMKLFEIIERTGLKDFISLEERYILGVSCTGHVIATGGSVVYGAQAMEHLKKSGIVIHLDISFENLEIRLQDIKSRGVVISEGQTLQSLYDERQDLYQKYADLTVNCNHKNPEQVLESILGKLPGQV